MAAVLSCPKVYGRRVTLVIFVSQSEKWMPTLFPGMDPHLERRDRWHAVHTRLIVAIADALGPQVRPYYRVDIELRTYIALLTSESLAGIPDVLVLSSTRQVDSPMATASSTGVVPQVVEVPMPEEIHERYLVVREVATQEVVTVIEILSLANKLTHEGREAYEAKRRLVFSSQTSLVEIDLLRAGEPLPPLRAGQSDYRILISAAHERPRATAYAFSVRHAIPTIPIPLRPGESEPTLPLNQLLHDLYDRASYDLAIDYSPPPVPPLQDDDADWANRLLSEVS
jgi:Protein of unknown function (DUF4058)